MESEVVKKKTKPAKKINIIQAVGRRKTAVARVALVPGEGKITINEKPYEEYVSNRHVLISIITKPARIVPSLNSYDVKVRANGGGVASQADAIRLGISRAIIKIDPEKKSILSKEGCLARDPRIKERKKYGRKKARKRFQFSKR